VLIFYLREPGYGGRVSLEKDGLRYEESLKKFVVEQPGSKFGRALRSRMSLLEHLLLDWGIKGAKGDLSTI